MMAIMEKQELERRKSVTPLGPDGRPLPQQKKAAGSCWACLFPPEDIEPRCVVCQKKIGKVTSENQGKYCYTHINVYLPPGYNPSSPATPPAAFVAASSPSTGTAPQVARVDDVAAKAIIKMAAEIETLRSQVGTTNYSTIHKSNGNDNYGSTIVKSASYGGCQDREHTTAPAARSGGGHVKDMKNMFNTGGPNSKSAASGPRKYDKDGNLVSGAEPEKYVVIAFSLSRSYRSQMGGRYTGQQNKNKVWGTMYNAGSSNGSDYNNEQVSGRVVAAYPGAAPQVVSSSALFYTCTFSLFPHGVVHTGAIGTCICTCASRRGFSLLLLSLSLSLSLFLTFLTEYAADIHARGAERIRNEWHKTHAHAHTILQCPITRKHTGQRLLGRNLPPQTPANASGLSSMTSR